MKRSTSFSGRDFTLSIQQITEEDIKEDFFPGRSELVRIYAQNHMKRFLDLVSLIPRKSETRILDIGIAYGFYDIALKKKYNVIIEGIELEGNIPKFCGMLKNYGIQVKTCDLTRDQLPFNDETFDTIIFSEVIEHLRVHPIVPLREISRVLKTGGYAVITTPNVARLTNVLSLFFGKNIFERFSLECSNLDHVTDTWTHIREYTLNELKSLIYKSGLKVDKVKMSRCWNGFRRTSIKDNSRQRRLCALIDSLLTLLLQRYRACIMIRAKK